MRLWMLGLAVMALVAVAYQGDATADTQTYLFPVGNGDVNSDQSIDISDVVYLLDFLYRGGPEPVMLSCEPFAVHHNGDVNGDDGIDISDPIYLLQWLFGGGSPPKVGCAP